nr:YgjV family protein [Rodentibacter trehalosifermentans]
MLSTFLKQGHIMELDFIELLGYIATFFVAASFLFKSIVHLRIVNSVGAVLFVVYGMIIGAYPVAVLNGFLVCVNLYQLYRLKKEQPASKTLG